MQRKGEPCTFKDRLLLQSSEFWKPADRMAKTLAKQANLRLILLLTLMRDRAILKEHKAQDDVSILVLRGRIRIKVDTNDVELEQSQMMVLNLGARHFRRSFGGRGVPDLNIGIGYAWSVRPDSLQSTA